MIVDKVIEDENDNNTLFRSVTLVSFKSWFMNRGSLLSILWLRSLSDNSLVSDEKTKKNKGIKKWIPDTSGLYDVHLTCMYNITCLLSELLKPIRPLFFCLFFHCNELFPLSYFTNVLMTITTEHDGWPVPYILGLIEFIHRIIVITTVLSNELLCS